MNTKLAEEINSIAITVDDLLLATEEVHKLPPEDRNWEGRLHTMARLFNGSPGKGLSVEYRLVAMSKMLDSGVLPGWARPAAPDGSQSVAEPVWQAAATEPLILGELEAYFDSAKFLDCVLSLAEPEGRA